MENSVPAIEQTTEPTEDMVRRQLGTLIEHQTFRSSRRSVAFLQYVVEQTLRGSADSLKERTIGTQVFGRDPSYDTSDDHVVRTAANDLRKRLAIYYGDEHHKSELRISLLPGSYVPHFSVPLGEVSGLLESDAGSVPVPEPVPIVARQEQEQLPPARSLLGRRRLLYPVLAAAAVLLAIAWAARAVRPVPPQAQFWNPVLLSAGPVLLAVGDVPNGPPTMQPTEAADVPPSPRPEASEPPAVPFGDTVTIARVAGILAERGKQVLIRRESSSSFSDLREGPVVLVGAFNNEWSLRLTRPLRFSLAMDSARRVIYIRDREHPEQRQWSWSIDRHENNPDRVSSAVLHDYALISRIENSETGQMVVVVGGLYAYGTQAAGEFLADPQLMSQVPRGALDAAHKNLQIVLETDVTQQTPGPPYLVGIAAN